MYTLVATLAVASCHRPAAAHAAMLSISHAAAAVGSGLAVWDSKPTIGRALLALLPVLPYRTHVLVSQESLHT